MCPSVSCPQPKSCGPGLQAPACTVWALHAGHAKPTPHIHRHFRRWIYRRIRGKHRGSGYRKRFTQSVHLEDGSVGHQRAVSGDHSHRYSDCRSESSCSARRSRGAKSIQSCAERIVSELALERLDESSRSHAAWLSANRLEAMRHALRSIVSNTVGSATGGCRCTRHCPGVWPPIVAPCQSTDSETIRQ